MSVDTEMRPRHGPKKFRTACVSANGENRAHPTGSASSGSSCLCGGVFSPPWLLVRPPPPASGSRWTPAAAIGRADSTRASAMRHRDQSKFLRLKRSTARCAPPSAPAPGHHRHRPAHPFAFRSIPRRGRATPRSTRPASTSPAAWPSFRSRFSLRNHARSDAFPRQWFHQISPNIQTKHDSSFVRHAASSSPVPMNTNSCLRSPCGSTHFAAPPRGSPHRSTHPARATPPPTSPPTPAEPALPPPTETRYPPPAPPPKKIPLPAANPPAARRPTTQKTSPAPTPAAPQTRSSWTSILLLVPRSVVGATCRACLDQAPTNRSVAAPPVVPSHHPQPPRCTDRRVRARSAPAPAETHSPPARAPRTQLRSRVQDPQYRLQLYQFLFSHQIALIQYEHIRALRLIHHQLKDRLLSFRRRSAAQLFRCSSKKLRASITVTKALNRAKSPRLRQNAFFRVKSSATPRGSATPVVSTKICSYA